MTTISNVSQRALAAFGAAAITAGLLFASFAAPGSTAMIGLV